MRRTITVGHLPQLTRMTLRSLVSHEQLPGGGAEEEEDPLPPFISASGELVTMHTAIPRGTATASPNRPSHATTPTPVAPSPSGHGVLGDLAVDDASRIRS